MFALLNAVSYRASCVFQITRTIEYKSLRVFDAQGVPFAFRLAASDSPRSTPEFFGVEAFADVVIAVICSVLLGLALNFVYSKFMKR